MHCSAVIDACDSQVSGVTDRSMDVVAVCGEVGSDIEMVISVSDTRKETVDGVVEEVGVPSTKEFSSKEGNTVLQKRRWE